MSDAARASRAQPGGEPPSGPHGLLIEVDGRVRRLRDPQARPLETVPVVTPVPLAPRVLAGLAQLDGEVLPVLWPGDGPRIGAYAVLTETSLGRVLVLCTRIVAEEAGEGAEPMSLEPYLESLRHAVRA